MVFVVEMLSVDNKHQYILGVYSDRETAVYNGQVEEAFKHKTYSFRVTGLKLDANMPQYKVEKFEGYPSKQRFDIED